MVGEISKRFIETARAKVVIAFANDLPRRTNSSSAQLKFELRSVEDNIWTQLSTDETRHRCSHSKLSCHVVRRGLKLAFAIDLDRISERLVQNEWSFTSIPSPPTAIGTCRRAGLSRIWSAKPMDPFTWARQEMLYNLLRQTRKMHPYRHDKMFAINHEISPVETNIDRPAKETHWQMCCCCSEGRTDFSACSIWNGVNDLILDNFTSMRRRFSWNKSWRLTRSFSLLDNRDKTEFSCLLVLLAVRTNNLLYRQRSASFSALSTVVFLDFEGWRCTQRPPIEKKKRNDE